MKLPEIKNIRLSVRSLQLVLWFLYAGVAQAQTVVSAEYFFDTDPGVGHGIALATGVAADSIGTTASISTTGLQTGFHMLYVRTLSDNNSWSLQKARRFYVKTSLTAWEYFFDTDPGPGNGMPVAASAYDSLTSTAVVSTAGLAAGYHNLYVRAKNADNLWGLQSQRRIYIKDAVAKAEYFFDTDPGPGNGTAITLAAPADSVSATGTVSTTGLTPGTHILYVRTQSSTGKWGLVRPATVQITNAVVAGEYFFDTDPGAGNGTPFPVSAPGDSVQVSQSIPVPSLSSGTHYLYVRTRDANGTWGLTGTDTLNVIVCTTAPARPGLITMSGNPRICPGETRDFNIDTIAFATSYNWAVPAGATIVSGQGTEQISVAFDGSFTGGNEITVAAQNACGSSQTRKKDLRYGAAPPIPSAITGDLFGVCGQTNMSYSVANEGDYQYTWSFDDASAQITSGQGTNAITASFSPGVNGYLFVTAGNGCGTSATRKAWVRAIPVAPDPISGPAVVCPHSTQTYSITPVAYADNYTWSGPAGSTISDGATTSAGNSLTTTATSVSIHFRGPTTAVKVRAGNNCGYGGFSTLLLTSGCRESSMNPQANPVFEVYPNPATDVVNVSFSLEEGAEYTVRIIDATGKLVLESEGKAGPSVSTRSFALTGFSAGMYHLILTTGKEQQQSNFTIQ